MAVLAPAVPYLISAAVSVALSFAIQALRGQPKVDTPKPGDISAQTAKEGVPRLITWGIVRPIGGNVVACSDLETVKHTSGGKGGSPKVKTYTQHRTYAIGICEGPVAGMRRVWRNNKLVYDARIDEETGETNAWGLENNPTFLEKCTFYWGDYTQLPDPTLEDYFGVGEVPAMRGTCYMVVDFDDLTDMGGALPQWLFETVGSFTSFNIYGAGANHVNQLALPLSSDYDPFTFVDSAGGWVEMQSGAYHTVLLNNAGELWGFGHGKGMGLGSDTTHIGEVTQLFSDQTVISIAAGLYATYVVRDDGTLWGTGSGASGSLGQGSEDLGPHYTWVQMGADTDWVEVYCGNYAAHVIAQKSDGGLWGCGWNAYGQLGIGNTTSTISTLTYISVSGVSKISCGNGHTLLLTGEGKLYSCGYNIRGECGLGEAYYKQDTFVLVDADTDWVDCMASYTNSFAVKADGTGFSCGSNEGGGLGQGTEYDDTPYYWTFSEIPGEETWVSFYPGSYFHTLGVKSDNTIWSVGNNDRGQLGQDTAVAYTTTFGEIVLENASIDLLTTTPLIAAGESHSLVVVAASADGGDAATLTVGGVVSDMCGRAGVEPGSIDVSELTDQIIGFYTSSSHSLTTAIEVLANVYFFDACNYDNITHFVKRGKESIVTLELDNLIENGNDVTEETRHDNITIPRVYHLNYYHVDGGLYTDIQTSDRSSDSRNRSEVSLDTTVMMDTNQSMQSVVINHKLAIEEQRGEKKFSLDDSYLYLAVGDVVTLEGERLRITELEIDDGFQNCVLSSDRASTYSTTIQGIPPSGTAVPSPPPTLVVGDTVLQFLDIPIIRDSDDRLGYYVGIGGTSDAWTGAYIELSLNGGLTYPYNYSSEVSSIMGTVTGTLPLHSSDIPDETNTLTVTLLRDDEELSPVLESELLAGANLAIVGDEIINFMSAVEISAGVWELDYLLRGGKGTVPAAHSDGERFVMLDRAYLAFIEPDISTIGETFVFRVTTNGANTGVTQTELFTGASQIERPPANLDAVRDGSGNIDITWEGVGKLSGVYPANMGQYFEGFTVSVNGSIVEPLTRLQSFTTTDPGGTPVTIQVKGYNVITGYGGYSEFLLI